LVLEIQALDGRMCSFQTAKTLNPQTMHASPGDADEEQRIAMKEKRKNQKKIPHRSTSLPPLSALQRETQTLVTF
jgi:hypothetical protein